jgi:cytochrome c553
MKTPTIALFAALVPVLLFPLACATQTSELQGALKLKADPVRGGALYETCAACHRPDGAGVADGDIPNLAGQHYQVILKQLTDFRDMERLDLRMENFVSQHHLAGPQDLADVAAYISRLPVQPARDVGSGEHLREGQAAYARACAHCHGGRAEGDNKLRFPRLAGQHYGYLVKQIDLMIGGARFNVSWEHAQMLQELTDQEIVGVADWLARLHAAPGRATDDRAP